MADYIKREDALALVQPDDPADEKAAITIAAAKRLVRNLLGRVPAADVAPVRHGWWEPCFEDYRQQIEGNKCSACGFEYYGTGPRHFSFCPGCGAKMDGGEESEM